MTGFNGRGRLSPGRTKSRRASEAAVPIRVTIPSDFVSGFKVQKDIVEQAERHGFDEEAVFAIKIATEEALVNAIKHGNQLNPNKRVHIEASVTPARVEIFIEDEGPGFDRGAVPDPLAEENLEKPSGRGILLIEAYMTRVDWTEKGRRIHMVKEKVANGSAVGM